MKGGLAWGAPVPAWPSSRRSSPQTTFPRGTHAAVLSLPNPPLHSILSLEQILRVPVPPTVAFELGKEKRGLWDEGEVSRRGQASQQAQGRSSRARAPRSVASPFLLLATAAQGSTPVGVRGWVGNQGPGNWPPAHGPVPADRTRPDLISEDMQRQFVQEVMQSQQAAVSRQLEDFRSKRLMGMTPWEQELAQLEAWVGRDRASFEARERHVAERLLAHLEEMQ